MMKPRIFRLWQRLKSIPSTLRAITILCWILGSFVIVASFTPGWENEGGLPVSLEHLWSEGSGLMVFSFGFSMLTMGAIIYKGWAWVRHALMLGIVALSFSGSVQSEYEEVPVEVRSIGALIAIGVGVRYFYFCHEVVGYFTQQKTWTE